MTDRVNFTVNGQTREAEGDLKRALLFYLRDELALTGSKYGCGQGICGACRVIVNGRAVNSCDTPLWSLEGADVRTVEGLTPNDGLNPVQQALSAENAAQCGYCMSGIVVTVTAELEADPQASTEKLIAALDSNLCRCGAHVRVIRALDRLSHSGKTMA
ncbi:(2Fe-2S)-binding protein [Paralimibaculum aggregatum]|uniref:(2Fe-2S)-binding protein n=1 Tax=Paralimibaculum aggregatum TaxID=3036245 RepID=A0ABQ6LTY9_9RHOB|nr:(2Fe-2S)-binding protein [Limibaculum sp. NKW23]GMG85512.1 (2Fe-2S)-binding protein [Limibaculum sp. NKW23]